LPTANSARPEICFDIITMFQVVTSLQRFSTKTLYVFLIYPIYLNNMLPKLSRFDLHLMKLPQSLEIL
jgi:hypothetical protein